MTEHVEPVDHELHVAPWHWDAVRQLLDAAGFTVSHLETDAREMTELWLVHKDGPVGFRPSRAPLGEPDV